MVWGIYIYIKRRGIEDVRKEKGMSKYGKVLMVLDSNWWVYRLTV